MTSALIDRLSGINSGLAVKAPCRVATTANITLSGEQTIDGVAVVDGDRVLVKDQSTATQNGIYDASTGSWSRSSDFDGNRDVLKGTQVWITDGTVNGNSIFFVTTSDPITIDSSSIAFSELETLLNAAPGNADYLVKTAHASLTAERVVTDTESVTWDWGTASQAKANVTAATTTVAGKVELATSAESITGTDTVRAVTPAALAATIAAVSPALPRGYIDGCILSNNSGDATNDIDIAAGVCRNNGNTANISVAALTKRLDANWAAGTNQGMRYSGAAIANGTYHIYAASKADATQDIYAYPGVAGTDPASSASIATVLAALQAETGGADYLYLRLIGSIVRASAAIKAFKQYGDNYVWGAPATETVSPVFDTTQRNYALTVPLGINGLEVDCTVGIRIAADRISFVTGHPDQTLATPVHDATPTNAIDWPRLAAANIESGSSRARRFVDGSGQVAVKASATSTSAHIWTWGFRHPRGRDA